MSATLPPPPPPRDDQGLGDALHRASRLVAAASTLAVALDELGTLELPPALGPRVDQAQLRAVASLYLASELERAGVVPTVETLAAVARSGGLGLDLGRAAPLLAQFWRARNDHAAPEERAGSYARLFGAGRDADGTFEDAMLDLCEALYKLDERATNATYGGLAQQARVRAAAQRLLGRLVDAGGGITVYLAQEILGGLRDALAILGNPDLRAAFGARDVWGVVARVDALAQTRHGAAPLHVRRGKAGMTVLAWLADASVHLEDRTAALVGLDHPVIAAAVEWMEAALAIGETGEPDAAPAGPALPHAPAGMPVSPWAPIAA